MVLIGGISYLQFELLQSRILSQSLLHASWQPTRQPRLPKIFETLKVANMAVVDLLAEEGSLTVDGGRVGNIALTKNPWISLGEVLGPLDLVIDFVHLLAQLLMDSVD